MSDTEITEDLPMKPVAALMAAIPADMRPKVESVRVIVRRGDMSAHHEVRFRPESNSGE